MKWNCSQVLAWFGTTYLHYCSKLFQKSSWHITGLFLLNICGFFRIYSLLKEWMACMRKGSVSCKTVKNLTRRFWCFNGIWFQFDSSSQTGFYRCEKVFKCNDSIYLYTFHHSSVCSHKYCINCTTFSKRGPEVD